MDELAVALFALMLAGAAFVLTIVLPIASFLGVRRMRATTQRLEGRIDDLESSVRRLEAASAGRGIASVRPDERPTPSLLAPAPKQTPPQPVAPDIPPPIPGTIETVKPAQPPAGVLGPSIAAAPPASEPVTGPATEPAPVAEPAPLPRRDTADTLESRLGGRGLLYVGAVALLLGLGFFVKYAFDNAWINETARVVLGGAAGLALAGAGWTFDRRGYRQYGQILAGTGVVALYISTFAAIWFYGLISQSTAFGLMVLVTAGAAVMADRLASHGLATVAVLGGFATPFLVGGGEDAQITLLTYDAILAAGTIYLAVRRGWPYLTLFAYVLSAATFFFWADAYWEPSKHVPTQTFLVVFCALFLYAWHAIKTGARRTDGAPAPDKDARDVVALFLATVPVAFHVASLVNLESHPLAYLVYLLLFTLAGVAAGIHFELPWLRLAVLAGVAPILIGWVVEHRTPGWLLASVLGLLAVYLLHLGGQWEWRTRQPDAPLTKADLALFHANGLALAGGLYALTWDWPLAWPVGLALAQAAWHAALSWATRHWRQDVSPNALALMFAMLGLAIGLTWDGWPAIVAWMAEGAAIVWVGLRTRQAWLRVGGFALSAWMLLLTLFNDFFGTPAGFAVLWNARVGAVSILIALLYVVAALYRRAEADLPDEAPMMRAAYLIAANLTTVLLASAEVNSYWYARAGFDATANLALQASLSILWAVYGTALIVVGIVRRYRPVRYLAIALLSVTILKVFLSDLYQLGGIYRIAGFLGLGVFLLLGAWLYQRYREIIVGDRR